MYICIFIFIFICIHVDDSAYFCVPELQNGYSYDRCYVHSHVCMYVLSYMNSCLCFHLYLSICILVHTHLLINTINN